jgi:hypothetical protein
LNKKIFNPLFSLFDHSKAFLPYFLFPLIKWVGKSSSFWVFWCQSANRRVEYYQYRCLWFTKFYFRQEFQSHCPWRYFSLFIRWNCFGLQVRPAYCSKFRFMWTGWNCLLPIILHFACSSQSRFPQCSQRWSLTVCRCCSSGSYCSK